MVGAEQRVDEEPRDVDVGRVDGGQVVDQRVAEVEVGAVRLVGQLAQLRVALALGHRHRIGGLPGWRGRSASPARPSATLASQRRRGCA